MSNEHVIRANGTACAVFDRVRGSGDLAPLTDPVGNLARLYFHSSNDYYALAQAPATKTISHAAIAADTGVVVYNDPTAGFSIHYYYGRTVTDYQLATHSLGYPPICLVLDENGYALPNSWPIQKNTGGHRGVSIYATDTDIRMKEIAAPGNNSLSVLSKTYAIYVFALPAPDPDKPMLRLQAGDVIFGQGKFDLSQFRLRRAVAGETPQIYIPDGRMADIEDGCARFVQGDGTFTDINTSTNTYAGGFEGTGPIPAVVE